MKFQTKFQTLKQKELKQIGIKMGVLKKQIKKLQCKAYNQKLRLEKTKNAGMKEHWQNKNFETKQAIRKLYAELGVYEKYYKKSKNHYKH